LRYGGRPSDKLVRCYLKQSIGCFRVELELHSALLLRFGAVRVEDLAKLPASLYPKHIKFVRLDWQALKKRRPGLGIHPTMPIHKALAVLQRCGVNNPHRSLISLSINKDILRALKRWTRKYPKYV
jgi:hypothetical protein